MSGHIFFSVTAAAFAFTLFIFYFSLLQTVLARGTKIARAKKKFPPLRRRRSILYYNICTSAYMYIYSFFVLSFVVWGKKTTARPANYVCRRGYILRIICAANQPTRHPRVRSRPAPPPPRESF